MNGTTLPDGPAVVSDDIHEPSPPTVAVEPTAANAPENINPPVPPATYTPEQEVRFAVVMYGGVSLAVYINGVAQELYRLVKATAPSRPTSESLDALRYSDDELVGSSTAVYRKLGRMLGLTNKDSASDTDPVRTRFVVDIISGTSAGGINGVFLAKALANDQDLKGIANLWRENADLSKLLNDNDTVRGTPIKLPDPLPALLNGQRIYRFLLDALDQMEPDKVVQRTKKDQTISPYTDELDLFVTATDLSGLILPIRLADNVIRERRYKNVFRFRYSTDYAAGENRNDFHAANNPFLAYTARCTSAFPFAFEPMMLGDIDETLTTLGLYSSDPAARSNNPDWKQYYSDYNRSGVIDFTKRAFGDGGYLDNYPFSYAIDTLKIRSADLPVTRKLLYVEPSPSHPERERDPDARPDFVDNVLKALTEIPRAETIREDLQRTLDRNRLIDRLTRITADLETDVAVAGKGGKTAQGGAAWASHDLKQMILFHGAAYGAYHRLKVYSVTDDLTRVVTRLVADIDEMSDQFLAVRYLVRAWREKTYVTYLPDGGGDGELTQNKFLLDFDFGYRLRRINFVRRKADELYRLDGQAKKVLGAAQMDTSIIDSDKAAEFQQVCKRIKAELTRSFIDLRRVECGLSKPPSASDTDSPEAKLLDLIHKMGLPNDGLMAELLAPSTEDDREALAGKMLDNPQTLAAVEEFAAALAEHYLRAYGKSSNRAIAALNIEKSAGSLSEPERVARKVLRHFYDGYDSYDMIMFPVIHGSDIGEPVPIDVHRVSPEDATHPFLETDDRKKLAGTTFGHFGAFLQRFWRDNDMLWGRMDGAERLIRLLTPHVSTEQQDGLVAEAQRAIIQEEIRENDRETIANLLVQFMMRDTRNLRTGGQPPGLDDVIKFLDSDPSINRSANLRALLQGCLDDDSLRAFLGTGYEVDRRLSAETGVRLAARATAVVGKMIDGLARSKRFDNPVTKWMPLIGKVFVGVVEVAIPRSFGNLIFKQWLKLLYAFEIFTIVAGTLLVSPETANVGWKALGITFVLNYVVLLVNQYIRSERRAWRLLQALVLAVLALLLFVGCRNVRGFVTRRATTAVHWIAKTFGTKTKSAGAALTQR